MSVLPRPLVTGALLLAGALTVSLATAPSSAAHGGRQLTATLTGAAERPGPGDPDGRGWADVRVHHSHGQVCVALKVRDIEMATAAHIHKAPPDQPGPVVVPLTTPSSGASSGCHAADEELLRDIRRNPGAYYVNVHNAQFPGGALRGQLHH